VTRRAKSRGDREKSEAWAFFARVKCGASAASKHREITMVRVGEQGRREN
jgi:hypothetical protein